jgi:hypothetical protein
MSEMDRVKIKEDAAKLSAINSDNSIEAIQAAVDLLGQFLCDINRLADAAGRKPSEHT